jgi:hypothetical protein
LVVRWFLFKVFGRRVVLGYGSVALLSVAVLAALYLTSRYALHDYVVDQIDRIPWDISVVQRGEAHRFPALQAEYGRLEAVRAVEALGFLRIRNMNPVWLEVDARPFPVRWVSFVAASRPALLPPELAGGLPADVVQADGGAAARVGAALVGVHGGTDDAGGMAAAIGSSSLVRVFQTEIEGEETEETDDHSHGGTPGHRERWRLLFEGRIAAPPVQLERQKFNRWMLRDVGSLSYLPEEALVLAVPMSELRAMAARLDALYLPSEGIHGGEAPPPYVPEITHLIGLDRGAWVSPWELDRSVGRISPLVDAAFRSAQTLTPYSYAGSDLFLMLGRMNGIGRLVGLVTLLVAIPLLWMGWVLARTLAGLLVLNERRLIGLALIRGIPLNAIAWAVQVALVAGGAAGGVIGLAAGTLVPMAAYSTAGHPSPPASVLMHALVYFGLFLVLGVVLAVLSGRAILGYVRRLTPREAMARVHVADAEAQLSPPRWFATVAVALALALGSYKIGSWITGRPIALVSLRHLVSPSGFSGLLLVETLLNFLAVPLFLFGVAGVLMRHARWVQRLLSALTMPLVGALHWFVGQHMALGRRRIVNLLFVGALAMALSLLPQVAADSFFDRVLRGVSTSIGGNILLDYSAADLTARPTEPIAVAEHHRRIVARLAAVRAALDGHDQVASVALLEQFIVPGVYLPGQSGLALNVLEDPDEYLRSIRYEDGLGRTRAFSRIIHGLAEGDVTVSEGLLRIRAIPLGRNIVLGFDAEGKPVLVTFSDVVSFLPGQPAASVQQREGFVNAEIDYLNHLLSSDGRIVTAAAHVAGSRLGALRVLPSRAVLVVRVREGTAVEDLVGDLAVTLPLRPEEVRWEGAERRRVSKDMFIALALENMKVYMVGGLLLALAAVAAIGIVNFLADHRTFALLRLRGVPPPILLRISVSVFLVPVLVGIGTGVALGGVSGYGVSQTIWDLPRVHGVAGMLTNRLVVSPAAGWIVLLFTSVLSAIAIAFGLWLFSRTAGEALREG